MHVPRIATTTAGFRLTFYMAMAFAFAATVLIGFGPTFYLKTWFGTPSLAPHVHLHGLVFSAWIAVVIAQTTLAARGRIETHRRLGVAGAVIALAMLIVGATTAIAAAARGFSPPGAPPPLAFLAIPLFDLFAFAVLVGTGIARRSDGETHKRLMLLATIAVLDAAVARFPFSMVAAPPVFFALTDLFIVVGMVRDRVVEGRIHPAYVWGGLFNLATQVGRLAVMESAPWLAFAGWLTRL